MPPLMTMLIKQPERLKMLEIALKDKHPRIYENLKRDGDLQEYVADLEQAMMETYDEEASRAMDSMARDNTAQEIR